MENKTIPQELQENKMGVMPIGKLLFNMALPMIISIMLWQHRAIVSASRSRLYAPLLQFEKREILRSRCQRKLAYGCGIPLAGTYSIPSFSKL